MQQLPDREVMRRLSRLALRIQRGDTPGSAFLRTRQVYRGRGERFGLSGKGRLPDYQPLLTRMRGRATYRWNRVSPQQRVLLIIDQRDADASAASRRLLETAALLAGLVLAMPASVLLLSVFGVKERVTTESWTGAGSFALVRERIRACAGLRPDPSAPPGQLRRLAAQDPGAFVLLVTPYLELEFLRGIVAPSGVALALVEPDLGRWRHAPGAAGGTSVLLPAAGAKDHLDDAYAMLIDELHRQRAAAHIIPAKGRPLDALEEAIG